MRNSTSHYYQNRIFDKVPGNVILVKPALIRVLKSINAVIWLSQILYWYDKSDLKGEIYKSRREIQEETGLTRWQQENVEKRLKRLGVVNIRVRPGRPSPVNHIKVNFDVLDDLIFNVFVSNKLKMVNTANQHVQDLQNITKNTQENTQKYGKGYEQFLSMGQGLKTKAPKRMTVRGIIK